MLFTWPNLPLVAFASVLAVYATSAVYIWFFQSRLVYRPCRTLRQTPHAVGLAFEELRLTTEDGVRLHGWYVPCTDARATLLFCHGNGGNIGERLETLQLFQTLRLNALVFDYRGYGKSEGVPGETGTYRDAECCWRHLVEERNLAPGSIFLFGRSLGAAVAVDLAARVPCAGLILESPFTSIPEVGAKRYPWIPARLISRYRYASIDKIPSVAAPVLIAHSPDDKVIPFSHGQRLHEAARTPKTFVRLTGTHRTGFILSGQSYEQALDAFITKTLASREPGASPAENPPPA